MVLLLLRFASLVWHSRPRLCLLFLSQFLISGFPSVGDLGQELASLLNVGFGPEVNAALAQFDYFRSGKLAAGNVSAQSNRANSKRLGGFSGRNLFHSGTNVPDRYGACQTIYFCRLGEGWTKIEG